MNKFLGSGRLVREPEIWTTGSGKSVCKFTIAIDDGYGENKRTNYIPVIVWGKQGEACGENLVKGQRVNVEGRVQVRSYDGKDGNKKYATEVVASEVEFLDKPKGYTGQGEQAQPSGADQFTQGNSEEVIPF